MAEKGEDVGNGEGVVEGWPGGQSEGARVGLGEEGEEVVEHVTEGRRRGGGRR